MEAKGSRMLISDSQHRVEMVHLQGRPIVHLTSTRHGISACTSVQDGAELSSLNIVDLSGTHELLFNANNWQPINGWTGRAPWLWPVAGRTYAQQPGSDQPIPDAVFQWTYDGQHRPMPLHGFVRSRRWRANTPKVDRQGATAYATLESDRAGRQSYPFDYRLEVTTRVHNNRVSLAFQVTADQDNSGAMPFTLGNHFTFDLASWWGPNWLDGVLVGAGDSAWSTNGLMLAGEQVKLPAGEVLLSDTRLENALIPAELGRVVSLVSPERTKRLDVSFSVSDLLDEDAALWVTHRDPSNRFFCLEPWVGWPNGINSGRGRVQVEPGKTWRMDIHLCIKPTNADLRPGAIEPGAVRTNHAATDSEPRRCRQSAVHSIDRREPS
jgi:galactose mutarotase-like enzyme